MDRLLARAEQGEERWAPREDHARVEGHGYLVGGSEWARPRHHEAPGVRSGVLGVEGGDELSVTIIYMVLPAFPWVRRRIQRAVETDALLRRAWTAAPRRPLTLPLLRCHPNGRDWRGS